jgi:hypothetical protein
MNAVALGHINIEFVARGNGGSNKISDRRHELYESSSSSATARPMIEIRPETASQDSLTRSTAMERQAAPSIILSILIVCFFAVALHPRDTPGRRAAVGRADEHAIAQATSPTLSERSEVNKPERAIRQIATTAPSRPLENVSNRTSRRPRLTPAVATLPIERRKASPRRGPAAAFTIVQPDETMADVALRVYGDVSAIDILRRVNLDDTLGSDEVLPAGMLIRTPRRN